jgi:cyclopropane fatty-acyl-phospholipid synthase-like methyltransferase
MNDPPPGASIYDSGEYLAHNPDWHEADAPYKADWIAALLRKNHVEPRRIVEVGSGSGEVLVQLARHFPNARLEGWDVSPQAHAIAGPKSREGIEFHLGAWEPGDADLTMAIDVFEHVEDYMGFLRRMKRARGLKLFHIPLDLSVQGMLLGRGIPTVRKTIGHLHYFYKYTALATLEDCGFEVLDWRYTHGAEELPNRKLRTRLFNIPRRLLRALNEDWAVRVMGGASMLVLAE